MTLRTNLDAIANAPPPASVADTVTRLSEREASIVTESDARDAIAELCPQASEVFRERVLRSYDQLRAHGARPLVADRAARECNGHPAGEFDPMGVTVYCDGRCLS